MAFTLSPIQKRFLMFLVGCIGARLSLAYIAKNGSPLMRQLLMIATGIMATGFTYIFVFGLRKTGVETQGSPIWWNHLRPIHAILYGVATWALYTGKNNLAWKTLLGDTMLGLGAFLQYHYTVGSFSRLF